MTRLVVLALLVSGSAFAQARSIDGAGRITVGLGARYVDKSYLAQKAQEAGNPMTASFPVGPGAVASFAYGATDWLEVSIDLFGAWEQFTLEGLQPFNSTTYGGHLAVRATKTDVLVTGLSPYLGVGTGPTLVLVSSPSRPDAERAQAGFSVAAGFTLALSDTLGLSLDVRWLWARGVVKDISGVNAGGISVSLGMAFLFPPSPKRDLSAPGF